MGRIRNPRPNYIHVNYGPNRRRACVSQDRWGKCDTVLAHAEILVEITGIIFQNAFRH